MEYLELLLLALGITTLLVLCFWVFKNHPTFDKITNDLMEKHFPIYGNPISEIPKNIFEAHVDSWSMLKKYKKYETPHSDKYYFIQAPKLAQAIVIGFVVRDDFVDCFSWVVVGQKIVEVEKLPKINLRAKKVRLDLEALLLSGAEPNSQG